MKDKILIADLARSLVKKNGLPQKEAEAFVADIFETIKNGLETDAQVKVKGLGTFKIIGVEARESVSVNTGERVLIGGHGKVTFTPDTAMKETVNKPFSQFETVVLNDGVTFDDMDDTAAAPAKEVEEPKIAEEEPVVPQEDPVAPQEDAPVVKSDVETLQEKDEPSQGDIDAPQDEEESSEEVADEVAVPEEDIEDEEEETSTSWFFVLLKIILVVAIVGAGAYGAWWFISRNNAANELMQQKEAARQDSLARVARMDSIAAKAKSDSIEAVRRDSIEKANAKPIYEKYNDMDVRLKNGAYYIMGTKLEVKALKDDNSRKLARRWLGRGLECYIEVYNDITAGDTIEKGRIIKIPDIKPKKGVHYQLRVAELKKQQEEQRQKMLEEKKRLQLKNRQNQ